MSQTKSNANESVNDSDASISTSTSSSKNDSVKTRVSSGRIAKKSTNNASEQSTRSANPRRLAALATNNKLLDNFNPDTSNREKRKLERKLKSKTMPGAAFDSVGYHIGTGISMCDCLDSACPGCFFPCKKCSSHKCGPDCRNNRKIVYESVEFHGFSYVKKNPLEK